VPHIKQYRLQRYRLQPVQVGEIFKRVRTDMVNLKNKFAQFKNTEKWGRGNTTLLCAYLSKLAYLKFESSENEMIYLKNVLQKGGFELLLQINTNTDTQGIYVSNGILDVIAFRGTQFDFDDIKTDLDFRWHKTTGIHGGFYNAWKSAQRSLEGIIYYSSRTQPVYITGHSLGGAIAKVGISQFLNRLNAFQNRH